MKELQEFYNEVYALIGRFVKANYKFSEVGIVSEVNEETHSCKVILSPSNNTELNWCPVIEAMASKNGTGTSFLPVEGDHVIVDYYNGNKSSPIIRGGIYSEAMPPPAGGRSGEPAWFHKSGSFIKLTSDGKVKINGAVEIDITTPKLVITTTGDVDINAGGNVNVIATGNAVVTGAAVTVTGLTSASVTAPEIILGSSGGTPDPLVRRSELQGYNNSHVHSNGNGGANTGVPTVAMPDSVGTTVVTGE